MKRKRNRKKQTNSLFDRLRNFAEQARQDAAQLPAGKDRDDLLRKAEMAEDTQVSEWVVPAGLQQDTK